MQRNMQDVQRTGGGLTPAPSTRMTGTREWAAENVNIQQGCEHDCQYCYAKAMAIRFGRTSADGWRQPVLRRREVDRNRGKRSGTLMFSSTHDITPANVEACIGVLDRLLAAGNTVLVVTKPHLVCVEQICTQLAAYRDRIVFRFTMGSADSSILKYWEPGAPAFAERLAALGHARQQGFETSVSAEPMLDASIDAVVAAVRPCVSHSIWLGRANRVVQTVAMNCPGDSQALASARELNALWSDDAVRGLYERHKGDPLIRWKDSIKSVVGIPKAQTKGLDT